MMILGIFWLRARTTARPLVRWVAALVPIWGVAWAMAWVLALLPLAASAATITVNGTTCTLPDAISAANTDAAAGGCAAGSAADTLLLGGLTHSLASGPYDHDGMTATPSITSTIVISGGVGGAIVERTGAAPYRLFYIAATGDLTLQQVVVRNGEVGADVNGGAIYNRGTLTLTNSQLISNTAGSGGGLYNRSSTATLTSSTMISNTAAGGGGGGLYNRNSTATLINSDFIANTATDNNGGGLYNRSSTATLTGSDFSANSANKGGAIYNVAKDVPIPALVTVTNTQLSANIAIASGGGIYQEGDNAMTTIVNSRLLDNEAVDGGSVLQQVDGTTRISQSCIVNNSADNRASILNSVLADPIDAVNNWWGSADGPSGVGGGAGDSISRRVRFIPFLSEPILECPTLVLSSAAEISSTTPMTSTAQEGQTVQGAEEVGPEEEEAVSDADAAKQLLAEGIAYHEAGDFSKAIAALTEAILLNPEEADAYFYRGAAHLYLDEFEAALLDFTEAIRLEPESVEAHHFRGVSNFALEQYAAFAQDCTDALHLSGGYFLPVEFCITLMAELAAPSFDNNEAAIQDFDEAIRLNPDAAAAYFFRGLAYRTLGDIDAAIQDIEQGLRLDPLLGDILYFLWSAAYAEPVDVESAIQELERGQTLVEADSILAGLIEISLNQLRAAE